MLDSKLVEIEIEAFAVVNNVFESWFNKKY